MIVVVTGLKLKSPFHWPRFAWHAFRSFRQAQQADGCLSAATHRIDGVHHTITAWQDGKVMKSFARSGAHRAAENAFSRIATGRVAVFQADEIPNREEALAIWQRDAREV